MSRRREGPAPAHQPARSGIHEATRTLANPPTTGERIMRTSRVLLPRVERVATVLLEVCDYSVSDAVAAVLFAAEAHEREELLALGCELVTHPGTLTV